MATPTRVDEMGWGDLRIVLAIGRAGSLAGAARALGCTHSTVFRNINAIEERIGVRLFDRLPSGYDPTEAGMVAIRFATRVEAEFDAMHREITGLDGALSGHVILTAPQMLTDTVLPGWLAEFRRTHPGVHIEAVAGHQNLSLRRRQADIAIRATAQPPEDAIGRRICSFRFGFFATEECLARQGERHLRDMEFVGISGIQSWFVPTLWKSARASERRLVYHSSSVGSAVQAARAGMGVLPMAYYGVAPFDDLLHLSPYPPKDMALWLLVHPDLRRTTRVKVLKDFLADKLAGHASVFDGTSAGPPRLDIDWAAM